MATIKTRWENVTLYADGRATNDRLTVEIAMRQFRDHGYIEGFFLDASESFNSGPSREEIDFTGLN